MRVEGGVAARVNQLTDGEEGVGRKVREDLPSSHFDGKGGQIKEACVSQGDGVAVGHGDGDGVCGYLAVDVWCLRRHIVAGVASVGNEASCRWCFWC